MKKSKNDIIIEKLDLLTKDVSDIKKDIEILKVLPTIKKELDEYYKQQTPTSNNNNN